MSLMQTLPETAALSAVGLRKTHGSGAGEVVAVDGVDLAVSAGEIVAITGRSGSGKTTLLNLLGGLDDPSEGSVHLLGESLAELSAHELALRRRRHLGFVFQGFGLLPMLSAAENVEVPMRLVGVSPDERRIRALELLDVVGLGHRTNHRPQELSGGEQQRVAIARAVANGPEVILADEPTGQLDSRTGTAIVKVIADLVEERGMAAIIVTHDPAPLAVAHRVMGLRDGRLTERDH